MKRILLSILVFVSVANADTFENNAEELKKISENIVSGNCKSFYFDVSLDKNGSRRIDLCGGTLSLDKNTLLNVFQSNCEDGRPGFRMVLQRTKPFANAVLNSCEDDLMIIR